MANTSDGGRGTPPDPSVANANVIAHAHSSYPFPSVQGDKHCPFPTEFDHDMIDSRTLAPRDTDRHQDQDDAQSKNAMEFYETDNDSNDIASIDDAGATTADCANDTDTDMLAHTDNDNDDDDNDMDDNDDEDDDDDDDDNKPDYNEPHFVPNADRLQ